MKTTNSRILVVVVKWRHRAIALLRSLSTISESTTPTTFRWSRESFRKRHLEKIGDTRRSSHRKRHLEKKQTFFQQISSSRTAASLRQRPLASCWVSLDCNKPKIPSGNVTKNFEVLKQYESDKKNLSSLWENASAHTVNGQFGTGFEPIKLPQTERRGNQRLRSRAIMGSCSDINLYK